MKKISSHFTLLSMFMLFTIFYIVSYVLTRKSERNYKLFSFLNFNLERASERAPKFSQISLKIRGKVENFVYKVFEPIAGGNNALIVEKNCHQPTTLQNESKVELITGFVDLLRNPYYRKIFGNISYASDEADNRIIKAREMELVNVLQLNLLHPMLENIHILVWSRDTADFLKSLNLKNSEKLIIRIIGGDVGLKEQLLYASECLTGKVVAITNQDNTIGKGWDNKDYLRILKEKRVMYALTRHSIMTDVRGQESNCTWTQRRGNNCDKGGAYLGSHDTFILQAKKWNSTLLNELNDVTPDKPGMENLFLWFFKVKMDYTVLNPCQVLFVHHHHCVPIRGANRPRINKDDKSLSVGFTNKLE